MCIRSSDPLMDVVECGLQGYLGAHLFNDAIKYINLTETAAFNPYIATIFCGGVSLAEKIIAKWSDAIVPGSKAFLGPIPLGFKHFVSYGLAICTTLKVMQWAGLILSLPKAISVIAIVTLASSAIMYSIFAAVILCHSYAVFIENYESKSAQSS